MRHTAIILAFLTAIGCYAQSEKDNSILVQGVNMSVDLPTTVKDSISFYDNLMDSLYKCYDFINTSFLDTPINLRYRYIPNPGVIYQGNNMALSGTVDVTQYPGMMNKEIGMLGTSWRNERVNLYIGGIVNKYGFYRGLFRQLGIAGQFTYQISSPFSFTAFAYYYGNNAMPVMPNGSFMPPSMLGYYDVSRFGGYVNYNASEHFGIQVGGQVVERIGPRNHYEVEPIVTPYIIVGQGKKKIGFGLPVGQILYRILKRGEANRWLPRRPAQPLSQPMNRHRALPGHAKPGFP